jgi:general secretion pathway protein N
LWLPLVGATAFLVALLALFPLRAVLQSEGAVLRAQDVQGSIWRGRLIGASVGPLPLGDAEVRANPLGLLGGTFRARLETRAGRGVIMLGADAVGVRDLDFGVPLSRLGLPLPGDLFTRDVTVRFSKGQCLWATGRVASDALRKLPLGPQTGPVLEGRVSCRGGALVAPLTGAMNGMRASLQFTLRGDGAYVAETRFAGLDPTLAQSLPLAGFESGPGGLVRTDRGRLSSGQEARTAR